ncbi:hypothetical protein T552_02352 [Pneumocystis carinii B80]|uniref:Uncharacterized protein n=1 Tax=Pneumocystis carinii (strain B80) TaxID=1408658 RepID=A0A0W4ZG64_PNEC8|nr:hypothetical protein T552_02352 [Pneumocystis carinii B80]KTW27373.1 hypothetical protein T552_02352 [Pneumocystis carinii B80]
MAVLTIRLIRSFTYRVIKYLVLREINLEKTTVKDLQTLIFNEIYKNPEYKAYQTSKFDTLKIYVHSQRTKTSNRIINLDNDEWILDPCMTLECCGVENETELSFFNRSEYEQFKANPQEKW